MPASLARLLALPRQETELDPTLGALRGGAAEELMIQIPEHIPTWWYVVAGAVVALALLVWAYLLLRAYRTRRTIDAAISNVAYEMLKNVLIPNGNGGQIHVHYLLLTQRGLLVADLLDHARRDLRRRPDARVDGDRQEAPLYVRKPAARTL